MVDSECSLLKSSVSVPLLQFSVSWQLSTTACLVVSVNLLLPFSFPFLGLEPATVWLVKLERKTATVQACEIRAMHDSLPSLHFSNQYRKDGDTSSI
jgi:hypothetical protein